MAHWGRTVSDASPEKKQPKYKSDNILAVVPRNPDRRLTANRGGGEREHRILGYITQFTYLDTPRLTASFL